MAKMLEEIDIGNVPPGELLDRIRTRGTFVFDLETTALDPLVDKIEGISFYVPDGEKSAPLRAWYPFVEDTVLQYVQPDETPEEQHARIKYDRTGDPDDKKVWELHRQQPAIQNLRPALNQRETMEALRPIFENHPDIIGVGHHVKFDVGFLNFSSGCERGISMNMKLADSMLADFLCDENHYAYGLKQRVKAVFGHEMVTYEDAARLKRQQVLPFMADTVQPLGIYAMEDAYWTWKLYEHGMDRLRAETPRGELERIFWGIDMKICRILGEMECAGVLIDWRWLRQVAENLANEKDEILVRIEKKVGYTLNPKSSVKVSELLFGQPEQGGLGLSTKAVKQGKSGQYSTGSKEINHLRRAGEVRDETGKIIQHSLVADILDWRSLDTVRTNFAVTIGKLAQAAHDGRVHSHFNQTNTVVARLSCVSGSTELPIFIGDEHFHRSIKIADIWRFAGQTVKIVTHTGRKQRVLHLINKGPGLMFEVTTDDGNSIRCTPDHRFLTVEGWCALKSLKLGDRLVRAEVRSPQAWSGAVRAEMGFGPPIVSTHLRGGHPSRQVEDSRLRPVKRDRAHMQGDLRVGVSAPLSWLEYAATRSRRDYANDADVGSAKSVEGVPTLRGILRGDIRKRQSHAGGGGARVWCISHGSHLCGESLPGIHGQDANEARTPHARREDTTGNLFSEGASGRASERRADDGADRRTTRSGGVYRGDGHAPSRYRWEPRRVDVVADDALQPGVRGADGTEPATRCAARRLADVLRRSRGDLSAPSDACCAIEAVQLDGAQSDAPQRDQTRAPDVLSEPSRDAALQGADSGGDTASSVVRLLQELASGLRLAGEVARGRGGRRLALQGHADSGQRPSQEREAPSTRLPAVAVHDRGCGQASADSGEGDRQHHWTRIIGIAPIGVEAVWDIEVEEDHSYIAHGFVNHNSSDPFNFQNQPRDRNLIRKAFCAHQPDEPEQIKLIQDAAERKVREDELMLLWGVDYSQIELRVICHLSGDKAMMEVYSTAGGKCVHGEADGPCSRFQYWVCDDCDKNDKTKDRAESIYLPTTPEDGKRCPRCAGPKVKHQKRCRHVDLHQRTAEDVKVERDPLSKCLDGRTLLSASIDGKPRLLTIKSLFETACHDAIPGEHSSVNNDASYEVSDGRSGLRRLRSGLVRPTRATKIVVTKRAVVVATDDHRFQVIGDGLGALPLDTPGYKHVVGMSLVEAAQLEKGMKLPLGDAEHPRATESEFHCERSPVEVKLNPFTKEIGDGPATITLDERWAYFAGMFAGDGCASGNACVITHGHSEEYESWRQTVRAACDAIGLPTSLSGDKRNTRIGSRVVRHYFAGLGLCREREHYSGERERRSGQKIMEIPQWVFDGGPSIAWSYLAGLFDTDGTVGKARAGTASVTTKYPEFAGQIAMLLRWLGMPVLVSPSFNKTYERYYYAIHVLGEGLGRFQTYCPLRRIDKVDRLTARNEEIKRRCAPSDDEVLLVLDGGKREVYDFHVESDDHLYLQGGLIGHNNLNFGVCYRIGPDRFCQYADLYDEKGDPRVDYAAQVIESWFANYESIKPFHAATERSLRSNGWIAQTLTGRRRRLSQERSISEFKAVSEGIHFQVCGTAQDIIKAAMLHIIEDRDRRIAKAGPAEARLWRKVRILVQVHDELLGEAPAVLRPEVKEMVDRHMKTAATLRVPLEASTKFGRTWDDVH